MSTVDFNEYRDNGGGNTDGSLDFFFKTARTIAKSWHIARPLYVEIDADGGVAMQKKHRAPYTMRVLFGDAGLDGGRQLAYKIVLSGTSAGYGGEGPHGTATILRFMGVPESIVKKVFSNKQMRIVWTTDFVIPAEGHWELKTE